MINKILEEIENLSIHRDGYPKKTTTWHYFDGVIDGLLKAKEIILAVQEESKNKPCHGCNEIIANASNYHIAIGEEVFCVQCGKWVNPHHK